MKRSAQLRQLFWSPIQRTISLILRNQIILEHLVWSQTPAVLGITNQCYYSLSPCHKLSLLYVPKTQTFTLIYTQDTDSHSSLYPRHGVNLQGQLTFDALLLFHRPLDLPPWFGESLVHLLAQIKPGCLLISVSDASAPSDQLLVTALSLIKAVRAQLSLLIGLREIKFYSG